MFENNESHSNVVASSGKQEHVRKHPVKPVSSLNIIVGLFYNQILAVQAHNLVHKPLPKHLSSNSRSFSNKDRPSSSKIPCVQYVSHICLSWMKPNPCNIPGWCLVKSECPFGRSEKSPMANTCLAKELQAWLQYKPSDDAPVEHPLGDGEGYLDSRRGV